MAMAMAMAMARLMIDNMAMIDDDDDG